MKKLGTVLTFAVIAALGGGAIYLWQQLDAERKLNADLQARLKSMETAQRSLASLFTPRAPTQVTGTTAEPQPAAVPADPAAARARRQQDTAQAMTRARETLANPEARQAMTGIMRAMMPMMLPDLAKELDLSQPEMDKLMDLISRQTDGALGRIGGGASLQDLAGNAQETQRANDAQIAALLGPKYPQWKTYQETLPMRTQVNQLQATLAATGNKLSDAQTRPLIAALSNEQKQITQERTGAVTAAPDMSPQERLQQRQQQTAINNRRLVSAATPYMTPQQLEAYEASLARPNNGARAALGGLGAMMGGQRGTAAAPPR